MITVIYTSIDGVRKVRKYETLRAAQKFAWDWVGRHPELGRGYAVSGDGVGKIEVEGASLSDLFPQEVPTEQVEYPDDGEVRYYDAMPNPTDWMLDPRARFW